MHRFSRLVRICGWCRRLQDPPVSVPTAPGQTGTTHTVCEACETKMKGEHHD